MIWPEVSDTDFLSKHSDGEQVDRFRFMEENEKAMKRGGGPADGTPRSFDSFDHRATEITELVSAPSEPLWLMLCRADS